MKPVRKRNLIGRSCFRLMKWVVSSFPYNPVRVWALRKCGFEAGKDVYIAPGLVLSTMNSDNSCELIIGDRVSIGPGVSLILASDPNNSKLKKIFPPVRGSIKIGNDAWLGAGSIILPDVAIGECSVIAAGAVVNTDIEDFSVAAGVPAKVIRKIDPGSVY